MITRQGGRRMPRFVEYPPQKKSIKKDFFKITQGRVKKMARKESLPQILKLLLFLKVPWKIMCRLYFTISYLSRLHKSDHRRVMSWLKCRKGGQHLKSVCRGGVAHFFGEARHLKLSTE